jgi:alpha-glucosidase
VFLQMSDGVAAQFVHAVEVQLDQYARIVGFDGVIADVEGGGDVERIRALAQHFINVAFMGAQCVEARGGGSFGQALRQSAAWAASTHDDEGRATTRWCRGVPATIRCAMLLLLTLRGTPIICYGDEIGMTEPLLGKMRRALRDEASGRSRDGSRTPMQWKAAPGAGFTSSTQPWLPLGDASVANVETQSADRGSVLWLVHDLLALRRTFDDLAVGELAFVPSPAGTLAWHRGKSAFIAVNLGTTMRRIRTSGQILICTDRTRDQEYVAEWLELRSREAVVVRSTSR